MQMTLRVPISHSAAAAVGIHVPRDPVLDAISSYTVDSWPLSGCIQNLYVDAAHEHFPTRCSVPIAMRHEGGVRRLSPMNMVVTCGDDEKGSSGPTIASAAAGETY